MEEEKLDIHRPKMILNVSLKPCTNVNPQLITQLYVKHKT